MKTFFLALILGIFLGSIITNYFADPDAYQNLKEAKAQLFEKDAPLPIDTEELGADEPAPALFEVGSAELSQGAPEESEAPASKPIPLPAPETIDESPSKAAAVEPSPSPDKEPEPSPAPTQPEPTPEVPIKEKSKTDQLIEQSTEKAEEIVETVTEKAKEVAADAKPIIEEGIDLTIAAGIRAQYKLERRINSDDIKISVANSIVTLTGTVDSESTKQLAIEIAVFTKGVDGVEETLDIAK